LGIERLIEEMRDAAIVADAATGRIVLWNQAATQIFGYSPSEALELGVETLVPERLRSRYRVELSRFRERGHRAYVDYDRLVELPALRKAGEEINIEMSLSPVTPVDNSGKADGRLVLGIIREVTEPKRTYDRLAESERRFATVLSNARAYVYRCRNEPGYPNEFASDYALDLTGYAPEDLLVDGSIRFGELIVEEDRKWVWEEVQSALSRREHYELRYAIRRRDGEIRQVEEFGQGVYDEKGKVVALEGLVYDVTEFKRTQERLREAEQRYRTLVEHIPAVTYIDRADGSFESVYTSPHIEEMLGYTPEEWRTNNLWEKRLHPDDRERVLAADDRLEIEGKPFSEEYRLIHRDGRVVWVREDAVVVRDEAGEPLYWQGFLFDITERKEAEERVRTSEAELRALFEAMTDVILAIDREGRYLKIAPTNPALLYKPRAELLGKTLHEVFPKEKADEFLGTIRRALEAQRRVTFEYDLHIDERRVWFEATISPMLEDSVIVVARDVTERKEAEEALRRSEASLAEAQRIAHLGNWEWNLFTGEVYWSEEVFRIYGFNPAEFTPTFERLMEVVHPDDRQLLREKIDSALYGGEAYDFEHRVVRLDGRERIVHGRAEVIRDEEGKPLRMVGTIHDVTERKALEERLEYQALHDTLTGLPNRALFMDRLEHALVRARRRKGKLAVLFMDLDNFKVINDSLGHVAGDKLLVAVADRLRACLRPEDTAARLGGDEFTILLEDLKEVGEATRVAERIAEALRTAFSLDGREMFVTSSVGIALWDDTREHPADLLRNADLAMYRAKHAGKARYEVFEERMNARALERLEMENALRRALDRREFVVHYQPVVALDAGEVVGFEALVRWWRPDHSLMTFDEFVLLAEDAGLIVPIRQWALREVCRQAREWQQQYPGDPPPTMFANLSARQLQDPNLTRIISQIAEDTGFDPRRLELEITESIAMGDAKATAAALEELKALGVRVAIDDFGTGYSSLSYLGRFPVDSLKIARSFVNRLGEDSGITVLVSGMINLAHALGLKVVAEGVETAEQLRQLKGLGCDLVQGNYLSRALPGEAAGAMLKTRLL
jgi:diguanylate cyclase (GGDEF)-like protein/PAS domain S-box-containing protein